MYQMGWHIDNQILFERMIRNATIQNKFTYELFYFEHIDFTADRIPSFVI